MDGTTLRENVEAAVASELDRLGSSKALLALTAADLDEETVLAAALAGERRAAATFDTWATEESDERAREAFVAIRDAERAHAERVAAELDSGAGPSGDDEEPDPDPMHRHLRGVRGSPERVAAGMIGRPLVTTRTQLQLVNFFVNEADERRADLFRDLRSDTEATLADGTALLDALAGTDDEWERAEAAAIETVRVAYEAFAEDLAALGLDPKPIC